MEYGPPPLFRQGISARIRFIFFVLISVILILIDSRLRHLDNFRSAVVGFTTPLVQLVTAPFEALRQSEEYFISKVHLKHTNDQLMEENRRLSLEIARLNEIQEENKRLRELINAVPRSANKVVTAEVQGRLMEENRRLSLEIARLNEIQEENKRLRELINAVPRSANKVVTAEVQGRVADQFTRRLHINVGERDGIKLGMPVLSSSGAVGQITRVIAQQAEVTLITDHRQKISVMNKRTGEHFILAGSGESVMDLLFVSPSADIRKGDQLVTSGLDQLFPREIPAGTVIDVAYKLGETYRNVSVQPAIDVDDTIFVTVILTNPEPTADIATNKQSNKRRRAGR